MHILLVEDNPGDVRLIAEGLGEGRFRSRLHVVHDGEEALDFLQRRGRYEHSPRPDLILLDLNLLRKDGREVLAEVKADPEFHRIPLIVLTSSKAEEDVRSCYDCYTNSYVIKPTGLDEFLGVIRAIEEFWLGVVELPSG